MGLIVGSFLNVCIYRMPREESIVSPGSHCTACAKIVHVQPVPTALIGVKPIGKVSLRLTVAVVGAVPMLLALIVYTPLVPLVKLPAWVLLTVRSGARVFKLTLAKSSPCPSFGVLSESGVVAALTSALFVFAPAVVTLALISSVVLPIGNVPTVQTPVLWLYVLWLLETNNNPAGNGSLTVTPMALLGPALAIVKLNFTVSPSAGLALSTVLTKLRSAVGAVFALEVAVLFPGSGSMVWLETVALLTTAPDATKSAGTV